MMMQLKSEPPLSWWIELDSLETLNSTWSIYVINSIDKTKFIFQNHLRANDANKRNMCKAATNNGNVQRRRHEKFNEGKKLFNIVQFCLQNRKENMGRTFFLYYS